MVHVINIGRRQNFLVTGGAQSFRGYGTRTQYCTVPRFNLRLDSARSEYRAVPENYILWAARAVAARRRRAKRVDVRPPRGNEARSRTQHCSSLNSTWHCASTFQAVWPTVVGRRRLVAPLIQPPPPLSSSHYGRIPCCPRSASLCKETKRSTVYHQ